MFEADSYLYASKLQLVTAKYGMRFLCSNGHVACYAVSEKKKGKKYCSKFSTKGFRRLFTSYGLCAMPVEQVSWGSLMKLANRSFRIGSLNL